MRRGDFKLKRRNGNLRRNGKGGKLSGPKNILLITNGAVTEKNYLEMIRKKYGVRHKINFKVVVIEGAPQTIMEKLGRGDQCLYDSVWICFDRDDNTDDVLNSFISFCKRKNNFYAIISVPCFEIWLHAHYNVVPECSHQSEAIEIYSKCAGIAKGDKNLPDNFPFDSWNDAVTNLDKTAKNINIYNKGLYGNTKGNELGSSPSTSMGEFMKSISEIV